MKCQFKKGDKVIVTDSKFSEIPIGATGIIATAYPSGYGVEFTRVFTIQEGSCQMKKESTRICWFTEKQLKHG